VEQVYPDYKINPGPEAAPEQVAKLAPPRRVETPSAAFKVALVQAVHAATSD